jgi:hypothetical protein
MARPTDPREDARRTLPDNVVLLRRYAPDGEHEGDGDEILAWLRDALSRPGALAYLRAHRHERETRWLLWVAERLGIEG